ncbi:MAG: PAS domain S-box protein [Desulfonatronovibrio sp.]
MLKSLGRKIRLYRRIAAVSQVRLAEKLEITQHHLGCIERGETAPSMSLTVRICKILDIHPALLFSGVNIGRQYSISPELHKELDLQFMPPSPRHGVWMIDMSTGRDFWTKSLIRLMCLKSSMKPSLKSFIDYVHLADRETFADFYQSICSALIPDPIIFRIISDEDFCRYIHVRADLHPALRQNSIEAFMIFLDITESKELYNILRYKSEQVENIVQERTRSLDLAVKEKKQEIYLRDKAEKKAREKSEQLQVMLSALPAILYSFSPFKGGMEWHSPQIKDLLGISLKDLKSNPMLWHDSIHPDDLPMVKQAIQKARKGKQLNVEYRFKGRDGQWRWLQDRATTLTDDFGEFYLAGVAVNITEQKKIQESLKHSQKLYEAVAEDMPALICRYVKGCIVTYVNETYCECFGKTRAELLGTSFLDLMPEADQGPFMGDIDRLTPENPTIITEHKVLDKNGNIRWHRWTDRAIFDSQGHISAYQSIGVDITEEKKSQQALKRLSEEYETMFNNSQNTFFLIRVDEQNRCTFQRLNSQREALTGLTTEKVRGKTPVQALGKELGLEVEKNYQRCIKEKRVISYEEILHLPAGKRTWLTKLAPVIEGGKVVKIVGSGLDITDRKKAEDDLQKKEERLKLITNTSYDWEYWVKPDGSLEYCSPSCEKISGYSAEGFLKDPDLIQQIVHPEDIPAWNEHVCTTSSYSENAEITFRIVTRSGEVVWIEHKCVAVVAPDSTYLGRRVSNRDVTKRVNTEQELRKENERLRRMLELSREKKINNVKKC